MRFGTPGSTGGDRGFSLIEVIAVIAVMMLILALAVPAVSGLVKASKLGSATHSIVDLLALARQTALTRNCRVEVRFYEMSAPWGGKAFIGAGAFAISDYGEPTPIGKTMMLPSPIVITSEKTQNTLFRDDLSFQGSDDLPQAADARYYKFSFFPSGCTDLEAGMNWFITLLDGQAREAAAGTLPANYAVLQVDNFTGSVRVFRP